MNRQDFGAFAQMWGLAWEQCGRTPAPEAIQLAFEALRDQSLDVVRKALIAHMRDPKAGQYPPKVADVMRHITGGHTEDRQARAELAWRRVMDALGSVGTYDSAAFDDPAIHYAIEIAFGGWERAGLTMEDEMPFRRQDFIRAYLAWKPGMPYPGRLVGRHEREQAVGDSRFAVRYLGDERKAREVEAGGAAGGIGALNQSLGRALDRIGHAEGLTHAA